MVKITKSVPTIVDIARPTPLQPVICWTGLMMSMAAVAIHPG